MKRRRLLPWQRQALADAYADGEKTDALCAEFDVSKRCPSMVAKRKGVPVRPNGRPARSRAKRAQTENVAVGS